MKEIRSYILRYWHWYTVAILFMVIQVSLDMLFPQITKRIIDDVIGKGESDLLMPLLAIIFLVGAGRCVFGYFKEYIFDMASVRIANAIRKDLFQHIQSLSIRFFHNTNTGELMSRIKDDVDKIWASLGYVSMLLVEVSIHSTIVLICMFQLSKKLFIIPAIAMPVAAALAILMEKKLNKVYEDISEENALLNTVAQENLAGVRTVKAFAREKFEIKKFLSHNKRYYDLNMQQSKALVRYQPLFQLITKILPVITIVYGGFLVLNGEITLGTLGAFIEYCSYIVWPMEMLGWLFNDLASAIASSRRIKKIYQEEPYVREKENATSPDEVNGHITFEHVTFSIDQQMILKDITFDLPAGKTLGIMGATGSGKSSIIQLLQRFYDVDSGKIMLDGIDIRELPLEELRKNIALVMQEVFLFSDTIHSNVKLGNKEEMDMEDVETALNQAEAMEFIKNMENRYYTMIGERGVGLSGGQKQRISIARAISKKAPILVLDDSTSALDMETEYCIQQNLNKLKDTTKIVIAHRISAIRNADEILILENGRIVERGTHKTLLAQKGLYYETYMAQYGEVLGSLSS